MKITLVTQHYTPEIGAPQVRLSSLARHWVALGHEVTVLTALPNHPTGRIPPEYSWRLLDERNEDGVRVIRHWLFATPNEGVVKRTLSHVSFTASVIAQSLFRGPRPDVVVASSPTFFPVIAAWLMAKVRGVPFVFEVRDLWPGIFVELGILKEGPILGLLSWMEKRLYSQATAIVTVTNGFAKKITERGITASKIHVVPNGADPAEAAVPAGPLRKAIASGGESVVLYMGAIGLSHGIDVVLDAAGRLKEEKVRFVFVGEGARKEELAGRAAKEGLGNVLFLGGRRREEALRYYGAADLCLVSHRDIPSFKDFIPSKMFEIMAFGRPIVAAVQGESAEILERSGAAKVVPPGDPEALAGAVRELLAGPERLAAMGEAGRAFVSEEYSREKLARRYAEILEGLVNRA